MKISFPDIANSPKLTIHCVERCGERQNIKSKTKAIRRVSNAIERGVTIEALCSLDRKKLKEILRENYTAVIYDGSVYILSSDGVCVTTYPVWKGFGRKNRFDGKEKIRNAKKYEKNRAFALEIA